jgi:hypothetical protein
MVPALVLRLEGVGYVMALVWGVTAVLVMPPLVSASQDVVAPGLKGTSIGMFNLMVYLLGGGWAPWVVGIISDHLGGGAAGLQSALIFCSFSGLIGAGFFLIGARYYPSDMAAVQDIALEQET